MFFILICYITSFSTIVTKGRSVFIYISFKFEFLFHLSKILTIWKIVVSKPLIFAGALPYYVKVLVISFYINFYLYNDIYTYLQSLMA